MTGVITNEMTFDSSTSGITARTVEDRSGPTTAVTLSWVMSRFIASTAFSGEPSLSWYRNSRDGR